MKETTQKKLENFEPNRRGFLQIPNNLILLPISDCEKVLILWICSHEENYIPTISDFSNTFKKNKKTTLKNLFTLKEVIKLEIVKEIWGNTMPTLEEIERRIDLMIERPKFKRNEKTIEKEKSDIEKLKLRIQKKEEKLLALENKEIPLEKIEILEEEAPKNELKIVKNKEIVESPKEDIVFKNRREELLKWYNDPKGLINHRNIEGNKDLLAKYCEDYLNFCMIQGKDPNYFEISQRIDRDTGGFKKGIDFKKSFRQIDQENKKEEDEKYKNFVRSLI